MDLSPPQFCQHTEIESLKLDLLQEIKFKILELLISR